MTNYKRVSEIFYSEKIYLIANRANSENIYNILKFQPMANLRYSKEKGIHANDIDYLNKVNTFIEMAIDKQPDLIITPEGSIPFIILENIIYSKIKWPDIGKLWCLCMEGISKNNFKSMKEALDKNEAIKVILENNINYKSNVNSLFYLFRLNEDRLAVIIQLKNRPMADRGIQHEADDMSQGDTIYVFDLDADYQTKNVLINLICADAIHLPISELINELKHTYPLVINAQCNPNPFDTRFVNNRSYISSDTNIRNSRQIVANWANGTEIENFFLIKDSGNAYYNYLSVSGHQHVKSICLDEETFNHRLKNQINGGAYYANSNLNIWKFPDDESLIRFYIKKDDYFGVNTSLTTKFDPIITGKYIYNKIESKWQKADKHCIFSSNQYSNEIYISENENFRPIYYNNCKANMCTDECFWLYNDYFLGICLGGTIEDELKCDGECSNRTLIAMNGDSCEKTSKKRELFSILIKLLEDNNIPDELKIFSNNIKFEIDFNASRCGSNNIYNVTVDKAPYEESNWSIKKGIFAVIDTTDISRVETIYNNLYKITNAENRDQILLYYRNAGNYIPYKKPHELKSIKPANNMLTNETSSRINGEVQYEQD